jgi:cation:H+ antiporter
MIFGSTADMLSGADGIILLAVFTVFLIYVFFISKVKSTDSFAVEIYPVWRTLLYTGVGFAALFLGGKLVVDNAVLIARQLHVSDKLIALTVVAGGTSLPELATSTVAAYKKRCDIAVGNIVGSNIFNVYFILGVSSVINGADYNPVLNVDFIVLIAATILLFLTMFTGKKRRLDRWEAFLFVLGYFGYITYLLYRK